MRASCRVRFAPSPTGHVHIGNIRVAIFNELFARHHGGKFLLRVEDTDRERGTPEALQTLFNALEWLGIESDEPPVFQSANTGRHLELAEDLLSRGLAYREDKGGEGRGECVVFKMPREGEVGFEDPVRGPMRKRLADMSDMVIVRSNGTPVFHLANVVDDLDMGITHVIRGDDHIENTFRHILLLRALGAEPPVYAHLPMIVNHQGKPYSKRDGAAFVGEFREQGYLPEALFNFLALLGWSPGDDREVMSREEMVEAFSLDRVKPSPARFDLKKLLWMNGEYMRALPEKALERRFRAALESAGLWRDDIPPRLWRGLLEQLRPRVKLDADIPAACVYFLSEEYPFDPKAVRKRLKRDGAPELLEALRGRFSECAEFDAGTLEALLHAYCEEKGIPVSAAVHPVRVAVSGVAGGPGLFEMLELLGRDRTLARLERTAARLRDGSL